MRKKLPWYLVTCLTVVFIFIGSITQAQSKKVKEILGSADRLYAREKFEEARTLYLQHAADLSPAQQVNLGVACINTSKDNPERLPEAITWIEKSAAAGNTDAMNALSLCYGRGLGVDKDPEKEMEWLTKSADKGDDKALVTLGYRYDNGIGVEANTAKAKELYEMSANKGNVQGAFYLSAKYNYKDPSSLGRRWLKKSAEGKYLPAMLKLGEFCEQDGDPDEAVRWYTKIAAIKGRTAEHQEAAKRKRAIGNVEPSTDINVVKPLLMKLLSAAANNYRGTLSYEKEPLSGSGVDILSTSKYWSNNLDMGFKNALIRIEEVEARDLGEYEIKAATNYSYSADIVYSVPEETALRVFEQWVSLLKRMIPEWESYRNDENRGRPYFKLSGNMTNGKKVVISIGVNGAYSENVSFSVANR